MLRTRKRKVTAVLVVAVTLGAAWYVFREPAVVSTTDKALQEKVHSAIAGRHPAPLTKMTGFAWDRLQVFAHDTSDGDISDAVGDRVEWEPAASSYSGPSLWVFSKGGEAVRAVQMETGVPDAKPSWSTKVKVSGGAYRNTLHFVE
ncbi:hypothetical protein QOM21_02720 [Streptomyces sp. Pv4-95]|uniref:hypothetical protein n=1 Tax=Streptomyces sp. Pv4-95 TaxID=3049543 RepID=UPI0038928B01